MNNHLYNLYSQLVQERRSIYKIQKFYLKDANLCKKCRNFWKKILKEKENATQEILNLIKVHK